MIKEWLGESNGKTMLAEVLSKPNLSKEQARCVITAHCLVFDIQVDTASWDNLISELFEYYNCWFETKDQFDNFMAKYLV